MNVVLISPHFPPNYVLFSLRLRQSGADVFGIGDEPVENLPPELRDTLTDYCPVDDLHRFDQVTRACEYIQERYGPIHRLESHNEHWLESDARLREVFRIPGLKPGELVSMQRKSLMKEVFSSAGVPVARGRIVRSLEDAAAFAGEAGYPLVMKPDQGVGASGAWKICCREDLDRFFSRKPPVDMFMEEFISGSIVTFDGLTDGKGNIVFCSSLRYSDGMMEMVNNRLDVFLYTLRELPSDLEDAGRRIVTSFGLKERFFHVEFFRTWEGQRLIALEINVRPPGGMILDMYNFASDMDLYREWAAITTGTEYALPPIERKYHCAFLARRDGKNYVHGHEEVLRAYSHLLVYHDRIPEIFSAAMGDYCYILRSPRIDEIQSSAAYVLTTASL